jgi:acyl-CoA thioester hydrolase
MRPESFRLDAASYPIWIDVSTRESDVDGQGHVNSLWLGFFFREGWTKLQARIVGETDRSFLDRRFLVVRITFDYLHEVFHPSTVQVGAGVLAVGRSSLTLGCGLFRGEVAAAVADYTVVHADASGPVAWPEQTRERAGALMLPGTPPPLA